MKNTYKSLILVLCVFAFMSQGFVFAQLSSTHEYSEGVLQHFNGIKNTQITYQVFEYYEMNIAESYKQEYLDEIQKYQQLLDDRSSGALSEKDEKMWAPISDDALEKMIQERKHALRLEPTEAIYIFSTDGTKIRQDVIRPEALNVQEFYYLYDGLNGTMTTLNDNAVRTGDFLAHRWTDFGCFARFGSGLEKAFKQSENYQTQLISEGGKQKLIVETAFLQKSGRHVKFTLLDSNPNYWTRCDQIQNDQVVIRYNCEDFEDYNGLLIPKIVNCQKPYADGFRDDFVLSLIDVKVNNIEFSNDFFTASTTESPIVRRMDR